MDSRYGGMTNMSKLTDHTLKQVMDIDCSMTMNSDEMRRYLDFQTAGVGANGTLQIQNRTMFPSNDSLNVTALAAEHVQTVRQKTESLYPHFLAIVQSRTNDSEVFDTVRDLIQVCSDTIGELSKPMGRSVLTLTESSDQDWLVKERDTWRLLYALYKDRLLVQKDGNDMEVGTILGHSEKTIVEQLYAQNANLREYQLVVDWLEQSAAEQGTSQIGFYTDRTVGWENTLMQLKNADQTMFGGGKDVVRSLDPDAPGREKRRLHDLDQEDQKRLSAQILREIRKGRIEDAQSLCEHCGHPWQAAVLEGWRLHHDPNFDLSDHSTAKEAIEGNPRRDLWKLLAWRTADRKSLDVATRAIVGILCGHLEAAIAPLSHSWADLLWAYLKVQIDIRVESEIRSCSARSHIDMPDAYWSGKMSLEQIFGELEANENSLVHSSSRNPVNIIQKYLILDNLPAMMNAIDGWLNDTNRLDGQMLRFLTHVVLFMRQVGRGHQEDVGDRVIKAYVECLIELGDSQLVAFYTAAVPGDLQTVLYSKFLKTLDDSVSRRSALDEGQTVGLDVAAITCYTVETIRLEPDANMFESSNKQQAGSISPADSRKISALEWLTFFAEQKGELLWQANAMIRTFLAETKIECVRMAFEMIPSDTIGLLISHYGTKDDVPYREECSIKEYLCYQSYLGALDSFNDWTRLYHAKPQPPQLVGANAAFTERMASEHKEQAHKSDLLRWNISLQEQTRLTRDLMFNVLLFPERGFLVDPEPDTTDVLTASLITSVDWKHRVVQLDNLRRLCVPETVLLLHQTLHQSGDYQQCVRLADELVDEKRQLYAVYPKHKLTEIIGKLAESSLALMNEKVDPWGYAISS